MLTKHKDIRPPKDVKVPLKNVFMSAAYSEFFSVMGHQIFTYFQAYFSGRIILKHIEDKNDWEGAGTVPPENF